MPETLPARPCSPQRPWRIAQWASGNVGSHALRAVVRHPRMQLVGLHVHSAAKAGRDAGELCGIAPLGIRATRRIEDIVALKPDCVLYMPQGCDFDELCTLLCAGINIVTTRNELQHPAAMPVAQRARIEAACAQGQASIHATGSSPGFATEALPLVLSSLQRRLDALHIAEFADLSTRNSPEMLFALMGFGGPSLAQANEGRAQHLRQAFGPSLQLIADALGLSFERIEAHAEVALARHDLHIAAGVIKAGTVAAQRTVVSALHAGRPLLSFTATWYCGQDLAADWELLPDGWKIQVQGDAPFELSLRFTTAAADKAAVTPGYTAHRAVNAVPYVCAAAPGIRTVLDLPHIIPDLRAGNV